MYGFTVLTLILCVTSVLCEAPNCSQPPPEVTAFKIRQCCNGPPLDKIMKETYGDICKMSSHKGPVKATGATSTATSNDVSSAAASSTAASSTAGSSMATSSTAAGNVVSSDSTPNTATISTPASSSSVKPASSPASQSSSKSAGFKTTGPAACLAECMLNQTYIFSSGEYNKENAKTFLHDVVKDDDFTDILQKGMEECEHKSKSIAKTFENPGAKCKPFSSVYLHCVTEHANQKCPESRWLQTTTCNKVRNFITKCGVPNFK